jgi:alcohol dehydrogenase (cytochrome c)
MLYVGAVDWCGTFMKAGRLEHVMGRNYLGGHFIPDPAEPARGWLTALDASTGAIRWRYRSPRPMLAAITTTSTDLLFTGELDGDFLVLDARDGTVLHRFDTGAAMAGGVVTYQVAGKQYVAAISGVTTYFWRTRWSPARVTIFTLPAPDKP